MDLEFLLFVAIGFAAQLVDGALGMAFGIIASSSLIATGAPPAIASAAVHAAEIVTTGISGASHVWNRNVDRKLFLTLVLSGAAGGVLGAFVLTGLPEEIIKPIVTLYLAVMAGLIFARLRGRARAAWRPPTPAIGAGGGFLDAVGGGGWGPLVVSTLVATGDNPRRSVGSVNLAEFFIAIIVSVTFLSQLDLARYGKLVIGLMIGGALAAPLAGYLLRIMRMRAALMLIGVVVAVLTVFNVIRLFI
ncbi:MAG TPA: sulfite exporter TauE/SafE family protein [Burkholderiales bacterium]|nr:sulfite exporter TauE/SafE family protein [Burkholderiales bacterium]